MDEIQRKLAIIDKQLAGGFVNSYKRIISTSPLVFVAVGLIAGILIQNALSGSQVTEDGARFLRLWVILLVLCAVSAILFFITQRKFQFGSYAPVLLSSCALICFACLGAIRMTHFNQPRPNDIRNFVADEPKPATIRGLIVTKPYINKNRNWKFARFKFTDPTTSFYLKVTDAKTINGWAKVTGTVRVQVDEPILDLKAGDHIQAYCWLDRFKEVTNPGQFDTARYLARKNVFIAASIKTRDGIELLKSPAAATFTKLKREIRQKAAQALLSNLPPEDASRGLLEALLLGYRRDIDSDTYRAFRTTGLLHFISLSGMHLGILIGIIWWLCKTAGLMKPARAAVCIIAIAVFLLIVPPRPPTVRAAIIGWVFCASVFFRRHSNPINTLSLAAIILLLVRPTQLFEAGWQLSFASVLGILLFEERIHFFLYEKIAGLPWCKKAPKTSPFIRIISRPGPYLLRLFSVGLAAWLGGAGILLYHFYTINPFTSIWTVLVFPLVAAILTLGFLKIILFFLLPTLSGALGVLVTLLSDSLIRAVKLLAHLDFTQILIGHAPLAPVILYYCLILFAGFVYFRRPLIKKVLCTVMAVSIVVFLGALKWHRTHGGGLTLTCLDVSHGQAVFVQFPGGANFLFDAGSLYKSDVGTRVIAPFLDYKGISEIDAIMISHNDIDHINGIPEAAEHCKVRRVYANEAFFDDAEGWGAAKFLEECLDEVGLGIGPVTGELNFGDRASIKKIWPNEQVSGFEQLSDNDKSMALLIEFAGVKILLCSDIEKFAQRELLRRDPDLKADIVVVPHHGSTRTADPDFLKKLYAGILIYSCDRRQYERQQQNKPEGMAEYFYTPEHGAVTICIGKGGTIKTATGAKQN